MNPSPGFDLIPLPTVGAGVPPFLNADADGANRIGVPTLGELGASCRVRARWLWLEKEPGVGENVDGGGAGVSEEAMLTSGLFESQNEMLERASGAPRMLSA